MAGVNPSVETVWKSDFADTIYQPKFDRIGSPEPTVGISSHEEMQT
jgi:hypothetical protein